MNEPLEIHLRLEGTPYGYLELRELIYLPGGDEPPYLYLF